MVEQLVTVQLSDYCDYSKPDSVITVSLVGTLC